MACVFPGEKQAQPTRVGPENAGFRRTIGLYTTPHKTKNGGKTSCGGALKTGNVMRIRSASCPKGAQRGAEGISSLKINHSRASPPQNQKQNTYSCKKRSENSERGNRIKDSPACTTNLGTGAYRQGQARRTGYVLERNLPEARQAYHRPLDAYLNGAFQGVVHSRKKKKRGPF